MKNTTQVINAVWDGEVFRPLNPIDLKRGSKLVLVVTTKAERKKVVVIKNAIKGKGGLPPVVGEQSIEKRTKGKPYSLLRTVAAMNLKGPTDWSERFDDFLNNASVPKKAGKTKKAYSALRFAASLKLKRT